MRLKLIISALCISLAGVSPADAASKSKIDRRVADALERFHDEVGSADELLESAAGVLIFPRVVKAGMGFGRRIWGRRIANRRRDDGLLSLGLRLGRLAARRSSQD